MRLRKKKRIIGLPVIDIDACAIIASQTSTIDLCFNLGNGRYRCEKGGMSNSSSESEDDLPAISLGRGISKPTRIDLTTILCAILIISEITTHEY